MFQEYNYTYTIGFDFDSIIKEYELNKTSSLRLCIVAIVKYIKRLDDVESYLIDNEDKIARDLYDYIQSKND